MLTQRVNLIALMHVLDVAMLFSDVTKGVLQRASQPAGQGLHTTVSKQAQDSMPETHCHQVNPQGVALLSAVSFNLLSASFDMKCRQDAHSSPVCTFWP